MIMNNLDPDVAQFPQELITYGGNGQVFSNWAQVKIKLTFQLPFELIFNLTFYILVLDSYELFK